MTHRILYTMTGTCALAPNVAVEWLDAPAQMPDLQRGDHKKDHYLFINLMQADEGVRCTLQRQDMEVPR